MHKRVSEPPPMRLTERDQRVIEGVHQYRFLRRDQIQSLFFPSQNTANRRLQNLYQHGFLQRYLPPVQLGEGRAQAIYSLDERGANLIATKIGVDTNEIQWRRKDNQAGFDFLNHTLHINDFRIAITKVAEKQNHRITRWFDERDIKTLGERVPVPHRRRGYLPVTPDAFFEYDFGDRKAGFFVEMDMGTMSNKRFKDKVRAYIAYKTGKYYEKRFGISSLRVLTVTTSLRRLGNLKKATEAAEGRNLFWFTTIAALSAREILQPRWHIAGQEGAVELFDA